MDIVCDQGRWLDSAVRNVPRGTLRWSGVPRRVYTAAIGTDCVLATVRRAAHQAQWVVSMPGFIWDVAGEAGLYHDPCPQYRPVAVHSLSLR